MTLDALDLARRWQARAEAAEEQRDEAVRILRDTKNLLDQTYCRRTDYLDHLARVRASLKRFLSGQRAQMKCSRTEHPRDDAD